MINRNTRRGFTLIELLVVILIIGILAAVAVPQYQKAVLKARAVEIISILNAGEKAIDAWVLANGYKSAIETDLDIEIHPSKSFTENFRWGIYCTEEDPEYPEDPAGCFISIDEFGSSPFMDGDVHWEHTNNTWTRKCKPWSDTGNVLCNYLKQNFPDMTIE